jgi:ATP-dependent helicase/nuclease subunit B
MRPTVFSFPPSCSFIEELASRFLKGELVRLEKHPFAVAECTIYLPNRRLCRALSQVFVHKHHLTLLPRILPMGEDDLFEETGALLPEMPSIDRALQLAKFIREWSPAKSTLESLALADELASLLDRFITEELDPASLKTLDISDDHDDFWQMSLEFLKIITEFYPFEIGRIDASKRRNLILASESKRLSTSNKPVIAAGSTGSIKATRDFLHVVAHAKNGAVILPGLDPHLTRDDYAAIENDRGHPQAGLKKLIEAIGVERLDGVDYPVTSRNLPREKLLSRALIPSSRTHLWAENEAVEAGAIANLTLLEAADEHKEALALAIFIREKLEKPQKIVVVTPDRALAKRLKAELLRWNINADDTGGVPLSETSVAVFMRLYLNLHEFHPRTLMSFMSHEHSPWKVFEKPLALLDQHGLRGLRPQNMSEIKQRLEKHPEIFTMLDEVEAILPPKTNQSLAAWVAHLKPLFMALIAENAPHKQDLMDFLEQFNSKEAHDLILAPHEIEPVLTRYMANETLRPPQNDTELVRIMGLPEARAIDADFMILAGLNEATWPPQTETDPWLSRAMGARLGLEPPERRIALAAHDFVQALGIEHCLLSRALKREGNPTVASRWLQRIKAVISPVQWQNLQENGQIYSDYADNLDRTGEFTPAPRPEPCPPVSARPRQLNVTEIEKLVRDPYAIYARRILNLKPFDAYDISPGGRDRGNLIHAIFKNYAKEYDKKNDPLQTILALGQKEFAPLLKEPMIATFWVPRFEQLALAFVAFDENIRHETRQNFSEWGGSITLNLPSQRQFTLKTIADRLDIGNDGLMIFDYKTGVTPSDKQVKGFFAPQLPLTALIAQMGGFKQIPANIHLKSFAYIKVTGAEEEIKPQYIKEPELITNETKANLLELLTKFENEDTPYQSKSHSFKQGDFGEFDHLARVEEWQTGDEE